CVGLLRRGNDRVDVADDDLHHRRTWIGDLGLFVQLAFDIAELSQFKIERALQLCHRDAQRRPGRIRENLRSGTLKWADLAVQAEDGLIERERLVDVVRRMNGVHQADHARLVRGIRYWRLSRSDRTREQTGCDDFKCTHGISPWNWYAGGHDLN